MKRRGFVALSCALLALLRPRDVQGIEFPPVVPGRALRFPDDEGSHPEFRIEWWYATGCLIDSARNRLGFQITFFRNRAVDTGGNPSRFAPEQLMVAHAAFSDPQRGHLLHDQQIARSGFGLAGAATAVTDASAGGWRLFADGASLRVRTTGRLFNIDLA
ncbi:MAG: carotenoid 1,2-hydratase, partial [Betaproteobacteria bacterium]